MFSLLRRLMANIALQIVSLAILIGLVGVAYATYTTITPASIATGQPLSQSLMQQIKDNLDDLNSRAMSVEQLANKTGYRLWTYNATDLNHYWYGSGTNFRNCEVVEYFQHLETIQNTIVYSILHHNLGINRIQWQHSLKYSMWLRDFDTSYTDVNHFHYGSWATLKYGPSGLEKCTIDS